MLQIDMFNNVYGKNIRILISELVEIWQTIRNDRKRHMHMLKGALENEIHG